MSFEVIIPFLKPIEHLLASRTVSEIMVNPDGSVWMEEKGRIELLPEIRFEEGALLTSLEVIANRFGKKLDADSPILNLRLPDGSRMAALIPPVSQSPAHDDYKKVHLAWLHHERPDRAQNADRGAGQTAHRCNPPRR
jgi:type IV secretory pathway ATPase VirB11/archaellum biosynthesis ATPase